MPAASPASTPAGESSTTAHDAGSQPMLAAAWRKRSGAGLPCSTSVALKIRPSPVRADEVGCVKRSSRPVRPSVKRIFSCDALEATQVGRSIASSASTTPGTGASSVSKTANISSK
jgi:hypothetical protein